MRFISVCVAFILLYSSLVIASLYQRDLQRRRYYTLHIPNGNVEAAKQVSQHLNARYEGQIGELKQYHEISIEKPALSKRGYDDHNYSVDTLITKFNQLKDKRKRRSMKRDMLTLNIVDQVNTLTPQLRRQRIVKRAPPSYIQKRQDDDDDNNNDDDDDDVSANESQVAIVNTQDYLKLPNGFELLKQTLEVTDPGFEYQWHLVNQDSPGHDINATGVWSQGITGKGVVVAILDDGLDMDNEDLKDNFFAEGSYDFNDHTALPKPKLLDDTHGTRCAGEIAAVKNGACGIGVAYDSKVAGVRILSAEITDEDEARALNYKYQENHIYSCSWGPPDYGEVAEAPQGIVLDAIKNGIENGRNGSGSIFVFASGNGGGNDDNCNFDGYTNSIYTITVGAIDHLGNHPYYSERCSAQLVVTYSSGSGGNIYTTDIGQNQCTDRHGGTSAAAPLAAGIFALVLSVRPDLTWRDMQYLCVQTAIPISVEDSDWELLPSGRMYNHKFGYGKLDAFAIVERAKTFENVGPQTYLQVSSPRHVRDIPDRSSPHNKLATLTDSITITQEMVDDAGIAKLEHVTVTVYIEHGRRGDLEILLESPQNVTSQLGTPRKFDISSEGLIDWTFMTVKHWEEEPAGDWKLHIIDWKNPQFTGKFTNWTITLWGELVEEPADEIIHVPTIKATPTITRINTGSKPTYANHIPSTIKTIIQQSTIQPSVLEPFTTFGSILPSQSPVLDSDTHIINDDNNNNNNSSDNENDSINALPNNSTQFDNLSVDNENESSPSIIIIFMIIVAMCLFAWILRRRIKGPGMAKEITAYSTINQHQYDTSHFEFNSLHNSNNDKRVHLLSDSNSDTSDDINQSSHSFDETNGDFNTDFSDTSSRVHSPTLQHQQGF